MSSGLLQTISFEKSTNIISISAPSLKTITQFDRFVSCDVEELFLKVCDSQYISHFKPVSLITKIWTNLTLTVVIFIKAEQILTGTRSRVNI